jgi:hypothetical protein
MPAPYLLLLALAVVVVFRFVVFPSIDNEPDWLRVAAFVLVGRARRAGCLYALIRFVVWAARR